MPFVIRRTKKNNKWCYSVINRKSHRVHSKCATRKNAQRQLRLLRAIIYNKDFKIRPKSNRQTRRYAQMRATKKYHVLDYRK